MSGPTHPPTPDNDRLVHRAIDELRRVPPLDRAAIDRVVQAAAAARLAQPETPFVAPVRARSVRLWGAIGLAAAAGIIGFVARGEWASRAAPAAQRAETVAFASPTPPQTSARFAAADPSAAVAVPAQFVFEHVKAKRVSVVGDFNNWNPTAAPMEQSANGVWSAVVPILPGRHIYAFMVDDSVLTLDPRAPKVRDPDFGTDGSLRMVGRP